MVRFLLSPTASTHNVHAPFKPGQPITGQHVCRLPQNAEVRGSSSLARKFIFPLSRVAHVTSVFAQLSQAISQPAHADGGLAARRARETSGAVGVSCQRDSPWDETCSSGLLCWFHHCQVIRLRHCSQVPETTQHGNRGKCTSCTKAKSWAIFQVVFTFESKQL